MALWICVAPVMSTPHPQRQTRFPSRADIIRFTATLDSLRRRAEIPGLAVAVVLDGRVVLIRGFGFADLSTRRLVTEHTPFNIASVTKPLSAVVALRLVERGSLDLDRPLTSYRGFADFCRGVRADGGIFFTDYRCDSEPMTLRHVLSMTSNGRIGTRFLYNPVSFSWASRPMAEAAGQPFSRLVADLVFAPAGMRRSARIHRNLPLPPSLASELALPYHRDQTGNMIPSPAPPQQGDGAAG